MSHRFSIRLLEFARRAGVEGAHLRWPRAGRLVLIGQIDGHRVRVALPQDKGRVLPDGVALYRLQRMLASGTAPDAAKRT